MGFQIDASLLLIFLPVLLAAAALSLTVRITRDPSPERLTRRERLQRRREMAGLPPPGASSPDE